MAIRATVLNNNGDLLLTESFVGPNGAVAVYSSDISSYIKGRDDAGHRYISIGVTKGTGTIAAADLSVIIGGSNDGGTTKFYKTQDTNIPVLNTTTVTSTGGCVDVGAYPARAVYVGLEGDSADDDSDITFTFSIYVPAI